MHTAQIKITSSTSNRRAITDKMNTAKEILSSARKDARMIAKIAKRAALKQIKDTRKLLEKHRLIQSQKLILFEKITQDKIINDSKENLINLVLKIAEQVIGETLEDKRSAITSRVERILPTLKTEPQVIKMNKSNFIFFEKCKSLVNLKLIEDNSLDCNTAVILTKDGELVSSPSEHLSAIARAIRAKHTNYNFAATDV